MTDRAKDDDAADTDVPESEAEGRAAEFRSYVIGGILSLVLTVAAFGAVVFIPAPGNRLTPILAGLAVVQIVVQFRFFLHIDLKRSHRDDLQLILFTALILFLMIGGTIWILFNQHARMM